MPSQGFLLGPLVGGLLADPKKQLQWQGGLWRRFPYLLPCVVVAAAQLVTLLLVYWYMYEPDAVKDRPMCPACPTPGNPVIDGAQDKESMPLLQQSPTGATCPPATVVGVPW